MVPNPQSIPRDERAAATASALDPHYYDSPDDPEDGGGWEEDSLDGAGAHSLANSTWAFAWSHTSAARRQDEAEEVEEEVASKAKKAGEGGMGLIKKASLGQQAEDGDDGSGGGVGGAGGRGGGKLGGLSAADEGLRRRLGKFKAPVSGDEDGESGGGGWGSKQAGGSEGRTEEDVEDEATSSSYSDLKRGKRFKKLTKMLCSVQVSGEVVWVG